MKNRYPQKKLYILVLMIALIFTATCYFRHTEEEKLFKKSVKQINYLFFRYKKIPNNPVEFKAMPDKNRIIYKANNVGKNKDELRLFYKETAERWVSIDNNLLKLSRTEFLSDWEYDIKFCRFFLYIIWTNVNVDKNVLKNGIDVHRDLITILSESKYKLHTWTKEETKTSFWSNFNSLFNPNLSDKENIAALSQMQIATIQLRLNEFKSAINSYQKVINNYPMSRLAENARLQIDVCNELLQSDQQ